MFFKFFFVWFLTFFQYSSNKLISVLEMNLISKYIPKLFGDRLLNQLIKGVFKIIEVEIKDFSTTILSRKSGPTVCVILCISAIFSVLVHLL